MPAKSFVRKTLLIVATLMLSACAILPQSEPVQVVVADIESLSGEGMEMRFLVKLRVQNPNENPVEFDGIFIKLDVLGQTLATGVSDERGTIPRFGETVVSVPLTASALRLIMRGIGMIGTGMPDQVEYRLEGKLNGPMFGSTRFQSQGQLKMPEKKASPSFIEPRKPQLPSF